MNEEWFGITAPISCHASCPECGYQLDTLRFRPAYRLLKSIWNPYIADGPTANTSEDIPGTALRSSLLPSC